MDVRTMGVLVGIVNVLLAVVLVAQYRFNRGYPGLGWWAAGQVAVSAGMIVSALRGVSTAGRLAVPVYQALLVLGTMLILVGVLRFLGRRERRWVLIVVWLAAFAWSAYHTFDDDSPTLRTVGLFATVAGLLGVTAWVLFRHRLSGVRGSAVFTGAVFAAGAVAYLALAVAETRRAPVSDPFYSPTYVNTGAFLASLTTSILWTFGFVLMLNQRLAGALAVEARNLHAIFATGPDCAIISRLDDGTIDDVNNGFTELTGFDRDEVLGQTSVSLGMWVDPDRRQEFAQSVSDEGSVAGFAMLLRRKDGSTVDCELAASALNLGNQPYVITVARDVSQQRRLEAVLRREATTDSMTGLPNRRHFLAVCDRELKRSSRSGSPLSVAIIDIDHFKDINDTFGHPAGDAAVVEFARFLAAGVRDVDTVGRLGGDEFGILLPEADAEQAFAAVDRLCVALGEQPRQVDGHAVLITMSGGVVSAGPDDSIDAMLSRADRALYEAKAQGRNRVVAVRA